MCSHAQTQQTRETNFQRIFSVNVWCGLLCNRLIEPYAVDNSLTGGMYEFFLRDELPDLLEDILLLVRSQMYF